jgi:hypothetical protein
MNQIEKEALKRNYRDCALGVKAFQNLTGASKAFERLKNILHRHDTLLISSIFHYGIIKYSKPFSQTNYKDGQKVIYPIKAIKNAPNFSMTTHEHLLELRDTLVAHDDFDQIGPRLLLATFVPNGTTFSIPTELKFANKCILFPNSTEETEQVYQHTRAVLSAVEEKLMNDLNEYRKKLIGFSPEILKEVTDYEREIGEFKLDDGVLTPPVEAFNDSWIDPEEPVFSNNGYLYEATFIRRQFYGPEKLTMPNGETITVEPVFSTDNKTKDA